MIPTLLGITVVTFVIIRMAPGDPTTMIQGGGGAGLTAAGAANEELLADIIKAKRELLNLDEPIPVQYYLWLKRIAVLDFGESFKDHRPVIQKIAEALPITISLNAISLFLIYVISIPIGVYSATHHNSLSDKVITVFLFILYSLPNFWTATMLILIFGSVNMWDIFPIVGLHSSEAWRMPTLQYIGDYIMHIILPVICLTYTGLAGLSRYARTGMLEVIRQDYIRTARAKGVSEKMVVMKHAFRNSLIPIVTLMANLLPVLIGGSVIIEYIFTIPGMGRLGFDSVLSRDYPVIMAITTFSAVLVLMGILISDILYCLIDPRISLD